MPDIPTAAAGLNTGGNTTCPNRITEAVCIDTARVYDSCADKDCLADLRVYFTTPAQAVIDGAATVRCRSCEVLNVFSEIQKVPFSAGYYSVDATFFFMVALDAYTSPTAPPQTVYGLSVYSKKAILYGAEGSVKVFSSEYSPAIDTQPPFRRRTRARRSRWQRPSASTRSSAAPASAATASRIRSTAYRRPSRTCTRANSSTGPTAAPCA